MSKKVIGVFVGSLRKGSFSKKVANAITELASDNLELRNIEIGDLPLYNEDLDAGNVPAAWSKFRQEVKGVDGFLFVTPEYNRSYPAAIKNALDVGSRPYGQSVWDGKPGAIVSVTPGGLGAFGANHHLRQPLTFLNVPVMQQPEAYISNVTALLDANGKVNDDDTKKFFKEFIDAFEKWVNLITAK